jgi:hypothetical protein
MLIHLVRTRVTTPILSLSISLIGNLETFDVVVNDNSKAFAKKLLTVPSRHFLPLVYQIASRLNRPNEKGLAESESVFRRTIYDVHCNYSSTQTHSILLTLES